MKMYFVVKDDIPLGLAMVGVAHGAMMAELKWGLNGCPDSMQEDYCKHYRKWQDKSFKKVIVRATPEQFVAAAKAHKGLFVKESSLGHADTVFVAFPTCEGAEDDTMLASLPLYNKALKDKVQKTREDIPKLRQSSFMMAFDLMEACLMERYSENVKKVISTHRNADWRDRTRAMKDWAEWLEQSQGLLKVLTDKAVEAYQKHIEDD